MPTYEYACGSCGSRYEKREGFDAPARQKCQDCGKATAQRVLFAPPVVFKGSGFYKTDNRGGGGGDNGSSSAPSETAAPAASTDAGHGHSHGPGGHTHGTEAKPAASDKPAKPTTTTEAAAAG